MITDDASRSDLTDLSEDRVLLAVIAIVGALGVAIGIAAPARTFEPSVGLLMLFFAARTYIVEARAQRRREAFVRRKERRAGH